MTASQKLQAMGIDLPRPPAPIGSYLPGVRVGDLIYTSGQLPSRDGHVVTTGQVGTLVKLEEAQEAARLAAINALGVAAQLAGGVDQIARIVQVGVFVASAPSFTEQHKVANGASDFLAEVFGEAGRHARFAVGVPCLPVNASVELTLVAQVRA